MTKKCFFITYNNCASVLGEAYLCAEDLEYRQNGSCGGGYFYSVDIGYTIANASVIWGTVAQVDCSKCPDCSGCAGDSANINQRFDCLNGGCIPQATHKTPGFYANLAACQSGCAKNSNCAGECVSAAELAALQQAANQLKSKICK